MTWINTLEKSPTKYNEKYLCVVSDEKGNLSRAICRLAAPGGLAKDPFWIFYNLNHKKVWYWMELPEMPTLADDLLAMEMVLNT